MTTACWQRSSWLQPAWQQFCDNLAAQRLAHALMLQGPAGIDKSSLARAMAAKLLCTESGDSACGDCRSCRLMVSGAHPDYFFVSREVDPKNHKLRKLIIVDQIRKLIGSLQLTTSISNTKVALIDPAELMNPNAANALLKTLEEPPGVVYLILVCSDPARLPVTIRSRCQTIQVTQPSVQTSMDWLSEHGIQSMEDAREALEMAAGSPVRALAALQAETAGLGRQIKDGLAALIQGRASASSMAAAVRSADPESTWLALSQCSAAAMRSAVRGSVPDWIPVEAVPDAKQLSDLQRQADRNRKLVETPVRQDLLLYDWLLKWARLGQTFPDNERSRVNQG
jgi:DNA polymerase-3 subunit delta'